MGAGKRKLPEGWISTTLGETTEIEMGQSPPGSATNDEGKGTPLIGGASDFENGNLKISRYTTAPTKICRKGDLILCIRATIGKTSFADSEFCLGRGVAGIRIISLEPGWVRYYLKASQDLLLSLGTGTTFKQIDKKKLSTFPMPLPPLNEQKRIVAKIEELQARSRRAREALETIPDLLAQLRQSILAAAFRGDLTKEWRKRQAWNIEPASELLKRIRIERRKRWEAAELDKLKAKGLSGDKLDDAFAKQCKKYKEPVPVDASDLPELPEGWCWATADQLTEFVTDGEHQTPDRSDSGVPLLSARNIQNGYISYNNVDFISEEVYEILKRRLDVKNGDVLMSCSGSLGRTCVVRKNDHFAMVRSVALLRPVIDTMAQFISLGIMSPLLQKQIDDKKTQTAQANIFQGKIRTLVFPLATLKEQKLICNVIENAFNRYNEIGNITNTNLDSLSLQDQSILSKAFRGELVPQDPNDEHASILLERIRGQKEREEAKQKPRDKRRGIKMKKKKDEQREVLIVLHETSRAMTPEEVFAAGGFKEDLVDAFYEQLRKAVVSKQVREMREGDLIQLEAIGK